mmetsp:Transcript_7392/g.16150  ORF Transcript_7392/g.16150 Transcript_7392/m.16150 type:complete len:280 (-) Transcript_7392:219-1058(-)
MISNDANISDAENSSSNNIATDDTPLLHEPTKVSSGSSPPGTPQLRQIRDVIIHRGSSLVEPFADDSGSYQSVKSGLSTIIVAGCLIGVFMPKNTSLPTQWYRWVSSMIGYTYFLAWSTSFYPQVITNHKRKSTEGLSNDFSVINHMGYICYTLYTSTLYWSSSIQEEYRERYGPDAKTTVQSNDVAFAIQGGSDILLRWVQEPGAVKGNAISFAWYMHHVQLLCLDYISRDWTAIVAGLYVSIIPCEGANYLLQIRSASHDERTAKKYCGMEPLECNS